MEHISRFEALVLLGRGRALQLDFLAQPVEGLALHAVGPAHSVFATVVSQFSWPHLATGAFVSTVGSRGDGECQFQQPIGLACSSDGQHLLVADSQNHRVAVVDARTGAWLGAMTGPPGTLLTPHAVAVSNRSGVVVVTDTAVNRVVVFAAVLSQRVLCTIALADVPGGVLQAESAEDTMAATLPRPVSVAVRDGCYEDTEPALVIVANAGEARLEQYRLETGQHVRHIGQRGWGPVEFRGLQAVLVTGEGHLLVLEDGNKRLQMVTVTGIPLAMIQTDEPTRHAGFSGFTWNRFTDEVLIAESNKNHRVLALRWRPCPSAQSSGVAPTQPEVLATVITSRREWGKKGQTPGRLYHPEGVVVNQEGMVWVADTQNHRLSLFQ